MRLTEGNLSSNGKSFSPAFKQSKHSFFELSQCSLTECPVTYLSKVTSWLIKTLLIIAEMSSDISLRLGSRFFVLIQCCLSSEVSSSDQCHLANKFSSTKTCYQKARTFNRKEMCKNQADKILI